MTQPPIPELASGVSAGRLQILAIASLFVGGLLVVIARGTPLDGELIGVGLAGLLLVAPLPMIIGDLSDAALVLAIRSRWLSIDGYHRLAPMVIPVATAIAGIATYPIVVAAVGKAGLSIFVIAGAFVLFGVIPVGAWLARRLRPSRDR